MMGAGGGGKGKLPVCLFVCAPFQSLHFDQPPVPPTPTTTCFQLLANEPQVIAGALPASSPGCAENPDCLSLAAVVTSMLAVSLFLPLQLLSNEPQLLANEPQVGSFVCAAVQGGMSISIQLGARNSMSALSFPMCSTSLDSFALSVVPCSCLQLLADEPRVSHR